MGAAVVNMGVIANHMSCRLFIDAGTHFNKVKVNC